MSLALLVLAGALVLSCPPRPALRLPEMSASIAPPAAALRMPAWVRRVLDPIAATVRRPRRGASGQLAAAEALGILAACLRCGLDITAAAHATAAVVDDDLAECFTTTAARLQLGAARPWEPVADNPCLSELPALAQRSADSGTAFAHAIAELADRFRSRAADSAEAAAERAGVLIAGPLALCFLPAFIALGLVPAIAGLAGPMVEATR
ncbi:type II secretion system F family protein [Corynebacterium sp. TAE3-ERU12]|uniref:type II secretion system F family protein n=1 Tax=Corynebacterium sp. TAE3-ERU12 TaxID=2849491 RepID=UPI001C451415|nr:type II secretion system F family protein [Corynebacterium sp. TAE3-ERU12]MBV7294490.1 type II secretion system F family protein [Corynebacterium sp. TAE3-ERU12]